MFDIFQYFSGKRSGRRWCQLACCESDNLSSILPFTQETSKLIKSIKKYSQMDFDINFDKNALWVEIFQTVDRYLFDWVLKKSKKKKINTFFFSSWYFVLCTNTYQWVASCSKKALKFSKVLIKLSYSSNLCETNFILMIGIFPKSLR